MSYTRHNFVHVLVELLLSCRRNFIFEKNSRHHTITPRIVLTFKLYHKLLFFKCIANRLHLLVFLGKLQVQWLWLALPPVLATPTIGKHWENNCEWECCMMVVGEHHAKPLARLPENGTQSNQHCGTERIRLVWLVTIELLLWKLENVADIVTLT